MPNRATIAEIANWLKARDDFALFGHVSPDGDAAGSCIATALMLNALGKRAFVVLPGGLPGMYSGFDCSVNLVKAGEKAPFAPKTAISIDVSERARLGDGEALFASCAESAMLDHHATNPGFGDVYFIDSEAAACGEIIVKLIEAAGCTLTREMAQWLFIAISTDSGHFSFSNTRPETLEAAAKTLKAGIDVSKITEKLYRSRTKARTQLLGVVLSGLQTSADGRMAWAKLTRAMLETTGARREDAEGIVNYLNEIGGVEFACLAEEREGGTKFSLRAKGELDVAKQVAIPFGGGGHAKAAGCTLELPIDSALESVLKQAEKALNA